MIKNKKVKPPFKPEVSEEDLTCNFDEDYTTMTTQESPVADWISNYQDWFNELDKD